MTVPMLASPQDEMVLPAVVDLDSRSTIMLAFDAVCEFVPELTGRAVDDVLLEAKSKGLIVGDRGEGDGSVAWWSRLRLTAAGLRSLGHWPPPGREWEPGLWSDGYWGRLARPLLQQLQDEPPQHGFYLMPVGGDTEAWARWTALLLLGEADLVSGTLTDDGIGTLRISAEGKEALDPRPRNALDQAAAQLRSGARIDAIVTAVELGLGQRLVRLADDRGISTTHADGHRLKLSVINNALRADGAYEESDRAQVEAWLKLRNELAHPGGRAVRDAHVENVLQGIRVWLTEHAI